VKVPARTLQTGLNILGDTFKSLKKMKWSFERTKASWNKLSHWDYVGDEDKS
jgi:hypothetical protein